MDFHRNAAALVTAMATALAGAAGAEEETIPDVSSAPPPQAFVGADLLPPAAKPGECYARVFVPAEFRTDEVRMLKREASQRIEIVPARFETVEEQVLVKEATQRLEIVPAQYEWREEQVLVKPASTRQVEVPAEYEWVEERVLDQPAHTVWKKGRGPIQRVDNATGEILCLVEVPATYKNVRKRVLKSPATTREETIPAEYKTIRKQVQVSPPTTRTIEIPAEYDTVRVRKLAEPEQTRTVEVPAEYQTVTRTLEVSEGQMAWSPILCETNVSPGLVKEIQNALLQAGHDPGPVDGRIGAQTVSAVSSFQRDKGLPSGNLTIATLEALGVEAR